MRGVQRVAVVFAVGVILNFMWEMAQAPLYAPMGSLREATWRCFKASLGDGVLILAVVAAGVLVFRSGAWFLRMSKVRLAFASGVGLVLGVLVELWGLNAGRWTYGPLMPRVPGTSLGLVPLAQMAVLVPLTFWLAMGTRLRGSGPRVGSGAAIRVTTGPDNDPV